MPSGTQKHRCLTATAKYLLSKAVRDAGIKVVFTGEGADEMLGGYPFFRVDAVKYNLALSDTEKTALLDEILGANAASRAIMLPDALNSSVVEAARRQLGWDPTAINTMSAMSDGLKPFFTEAFSAEIQDYSPIIAALDRLPIAQRLTGREPMDQTLYINTKTSLPNFILAYLGDRKVAYSVSPVLLSCRRSLA
jgi:asparagine synthase (glutamine-hydrolysing)